jgi:hypothetical protein
MGLFSSKTVVNVFSNAIPLVDEDYNPVTRTILNAVLNNRDIAQSLTANLITGTSMCVNNMLEYARNHYTLGLSQGTKHVTPAIDDADLEAIITGNLSLPYGCVLDYSYISPLTVDHVVLPFLVNTRGYDLATDRVAITKAPPGLNLPAFYQNDKRKPLTHNISVEAVTYDVLTNTANIHYKLVSSYKAISYVILSLEPESLVTTPPVFCDETYIIPAGTRIGRTYCIAHYFELNSSYNAAGLSKVWLYDIGAGLYPEITNATIPDPNLDFFPVVPIRYYNADLTSVGYRNTDLYKTSKQLLKKVNLDINVLGDRINDNPNVAEIDHAYVMFGINLQSNKKESLLYLIEFFDSLYDEAIIEEDAYINSQLNDGVVKQVYYNFNGAIVPGGVTTETSYTSDESGSYTTTHTIINSTTAASLTESGLDTAIRYSSIRSCYKHGSIGAIGAVTKAFVSSVSYISTGIINSRTTVDSSQLILCHQITASMYKEVVVTGLTHVNNVYKGYSVTTTITALINDADNDNFIIPLHYGICKRLPLSTRNSLYLQSLHIVINGYHKTKVKWYQKSFFKFFAMVVVAVFAVVTQQYWMLAAMMVTEVLTRIVPSDVMMALKLVYTVYNIVTANWGAIVANMASASQLLSMVSSLADLAQIPMQLRLADTMGEIEDLAAEKVIKTKLLEDAWAALDTDSLLDAGLLLNSPKLQSIPNESPSAFYTRTLMNNAGVLTLNIVENYHESMLSLPEVNSYFSPSYS